MIRACLAVFSAALSLSVGVAARAQQSPPAQPPIEQLYRMPLVYSVPGTDKVEVRRELVYAKVDFRGKEYPLKLDAYLPPDGKAHPVIVLISGGGVEGAPHDFRDAGIYQSYGRVLAASGFVAISYSKRYERGPAGTTNGAADTRSLLAYLREHATELHVDIRRMGLWAFSAGGLMLAPFLQDPQAQALVCFYCISDLVPESWAEIPGTTPEQRERVAAAFSNATQARAAKGPLPPLFIGRAGLDSEFLNRSIDRFVQESLSKNAWVEIMNHPTGRHGFDILDDNARSREIIVRAIAFLQMHLSAKP